MAPKIERRSSLLPISVFLLFVASPFASAAQETVPVLRYETGPEVQMGSSPQWDRAYAIQIRLGAAPKKRAERQAKQQDLLAATPRPFLTAPETGSITQEIVRREAALLRTGTPLKSNFAFGLPALSPVLSPEAPTALAAAPTLAEATANPSPEIRYCDHIAHELSQKTQSEPATWQEPC